MISIIVAVSKNGVIGAEGKLPWHIPDELKRFREITSGHPIIMGRKTHESIGRILPNRTNIIITRDKNYEVENGIVVHSLGEALKAASHVIPAKAGIQDNSGSPIGSGMTDDEIFIIGGGEIYKQAMPIADKLYLTLIDKEIEGDAYFPDYSEFKKVVKEEERETEEGVKYSFKELEK